MNLNDLMVTVGTIVTHPGALNQLEMSSNAATLELNNHVMAFEIDTEDNVMDVLWQDPTGHDVLALTRVQMHRETVAACVRLFLEVVA